MMPNRAWSEVRDSFHRFAQRVVSSREFWILATSSVLITGMMMPEINITSSLNQEILQLAAIISGVKIASAYLSPQIRDLF